jgi:hypothetical protein
MVSRRAWLAGAAGLLVLRNALARGEVEKGVVRLTGPVLVNERVPLLRQDLRPGDRIQTGHQADMVFVTGADAMLVRSNTLIELSAAGLRVVTGAVLSVFEPGKPKEVRTPNAAIGIRGTAVYFEVEPGRTYVCTCYGEAVLEPLQDPGSRETVRTEHHDQPRFIIDSTIVGAPVINHTDAELVLLESLVGRTPPFVSKGYATY